MKDLLTLVVLAFSCVSVIGSTSAPQDPVTQDPVTQDPAPERKQKMELGAFSVSLAVKDLAASRAFYEKIGFEVVGGEAKQNWQILRNGTTTVGLFQGMFEKNLMTFNPGWSAGAKPLDKFTDVRDIQRHLKKNGVELTTEADESSKGPAHFTLVDPDGNPILFDQHVE